MRWSVTVFAKNEEASIARCLDAISAAEAPSDRHLSIVVNGSTDNTIDRILAWKSKTSTQLDLFQSPIASKANAWNGFIYDQRPKADIYFFVDAYAFVETGAFRALAEALDQNPKAHAASSIPTTGRSAAKVAKNFIQYGAVHGTLHALRASFIERIVERELRQPFGLYRGDGLIAAMAMHDLDPKHNVWDKERVAVVEEPTWTHRELSIFRPADVKRHFNRMISQARGRLENAAIRDIVHLHGFEALPDHADAMITDWLSERSPNELAKLRRNPFTRLALGQLKPKYYPAKTSLELVPQGLA